MEAYKEIQSAYLNRTTSLANLYHANSVKLMDLVVAHNKHNMASSHKRASELIALKDMSGIHKLIAKNVSEQMRDFTDYATSAYLLGCEAQSNLMQICQSHVKDHAALTNQTIQSVSDKGNPLTALAISMAQAALDASRSAITTAKATSKS